MSQNDEQIRKVYVKDLRPGDSLHTVFRADKKEKHTARSGKVFLTFVLQDKTGEIDGRVFENIDTLDAAFKDGDYVLLKGLVGTHHGKAQISVTEAERLDPEPIDAAEFTPPPPGEKKKHEREDRPERGEKSQLRSKLLRALEDPAVAHGLDAFFKHLEQFIDERVQARVQSLQSRGEHKGSDKPRRERDHGGPRVEKKPDVSHDERPTKRSEAPARDAGLPKDLAFKPFNLLTTNDGGGEAPAPAPAKND